MPTTTNFGWTTPADTDLVKDGALAIRTLANGIDTSMAELKGGTTGQVLSKTSNTDMDFTWVTQDDANAIQNTIVDAKGDLITATANDTPARLAVGSNGDALVADSSATTGLRWQSNFSAGKNVVINGDFRINQRNFTSNTATGAYNFDRWLQQNSGGTFTVTPQTFTAGTAPVAGYEGINFLRGITATQSAAGDYALFSQRVEDVRTFAGSSITISFWAKANSGTPKIGVEVNQNFGTGGSPSAAVSTPAGAVTLSTSWARYSVTVSVPSISGKVIGSTANTSYLELNLWTSSGSTNATRASSIGIQNWTADIWGVQMEIGSVATAFQTATGNLAGELAACQRYYFRFSGENLFAGHGIGVANGTTSVIAVINHPTTMRVKPTSADFSTLRVESGSDDQAVTAVTLGHPGVGRSTVTFTVASGLTSSRAYNVLNNNSLSGYFGLSAEL